MELLPCVTTQPLELVTIDTSLFDDDFKNLLLNQIDNLSQKINGTLISGDNFQALRFLEGKYKNSIDAIYIDPPYNTDASAILYKNDFKDSSCPALWKVGWKLQID